MRDVAQSADIAQALPLSDELRQDFESGRLVCPTTTLAICEWVGEPRSKVTAALCELVDGQVIAARGGLWYRQRTRGGGFRGPHHESPSRLHAEAICHALDKGWSNRRIARDIGVTVGVVAGVRHRRTAGSAPTATAVQP